MKVCWLAVAFLLSTAPGLLGQNPELKKLAEEDQGSRLGSSKVVRSDEDRVKLVLEMLAKGAVQTPEDKFDAALVLDHTGLDFCGKRLISKGAYNYLLAHYLAREAFAAGYKDARTLVAQTMDRYLTFTEGRQKYGTSRIYNQTTGKEELVPIDRSVSDSERAKYGIPPLAQLLKSYPEQKRQDNSAGQKQPPKSGR